MPDGQSSILKLVLIFLGSGAGGLLRFGLGGAVQSWWGLLFPLGTLVVNVSGCIAMGFLATLWSGADSAPAVIREEYRAAVLVGILGGYTTFSTFGRETLALMDNGQWWRAGGYVAGSVILGLLGMWFGSIVATWLCSKGVQ